MNYKYITWNNKNVLNDENIKICENRINRKLPSDFVSFIKNHNKAFIPFIGQEDYEYCGDFNLFDFEDYDDNHPYLPANIYPIALDGGGNYYCFDYRKNCNNPDIVLWDHESEETELIAYTFSNLLVVLDENRRISLSLYE